MTLVAISASYGAGGSRVGPDVADRLDGPPERRVAQATALDPSELIAAAAEAHHGGASP